MSVRHLLVAMILAIPLSSPATSALAGPFESVYGSVETYVTQSGGTIKVDPETSSDARLDGFALTADSFGNDKYSHADLGQGYVFEDEYNVSGTAIASVDPDRAGTELAKGTSVHRVVLDSSQGPVDLYLSLVLDQYEDVNLRGGIGTTLRITRAFTPSLLYVTFDGPFTGRFDQAIQVPTSSSSSPYRWTLEISQYATAGESFGGDLAGQAVGDFHLRVADAPEPGSTTLAASGVVCLAILDRRRRRSARRSNVSSGSVQPSLR